MVGASATTLGLSTATIFADTGSVVNWVDHLDLFENPVGTVSIGKLLGKTFFRPYDFDANLAERKRTEDPQECECWFFVSKEGLDLCAKDSQQISMAAFMSERSCCAYDQPSSA